MPTSPPRLCAGCGRRVRGRCPSCTTTSRQLTDRHRASPAERGYDHRWRAVLRPEYLASHPLCCWPECGLLAEVPDHWPRTRRELVEAGVPDPDAWHRLRPLCKPHHDRYGLSYKPWAGKQDAPHDFVTVVAGPPCAGKNVWVEQHRGPDDEVVDYDALMAELTGLPLHVHDAARRPEVSELRDRAAKLLLSSGRPGWIVTAGARVTARYRWRSPVVLLLPDQSTARARAAEQRPPGWVEIVDAWFAAYEPDARDQVVVP